MTTIFTVIVPVLQVNNRKKQPIAPSGCGLANKITTYQSPCPEHQ